VPSFTDDFYLNNICWLLLYKFVLIVRTFHSLNRTLHAVGVPDDAGNYIIDRICSKTDSQNSKRCAVLSKTVNLRIIVKL
jgi:hypothetical protein